MGKSIPEVDAYIARSPEFARPILGRVRALYHQAFPHFEETIKWGAPQFEYQGLVGCMAAFKQHVSLGFWRARELTDSAGLFAGTGTSMAAFRVHDLADLPPERTLLAYIREAVRLNAQGNRPRAAKKFPAKRLVVPPDLRAALKKHARAQAAFDAFSPSHRREYIEWITEAKQAATRMRRVATTIEWLEAGKLRNWKYDRKKS